MINPHQVLGVDKGASDEEVKKAYRQKAKEHHPDQGGDEEKFKEIQEAYDQITGESEPEFGDPFGAQGASAGFKGKDKSVEDFIRDFHNFAGAGGFDRTGFQGSPFGSAQVNQKVVYKAPIDFKTAVFGGSIEANFEGGAVQTVNVPPGVKTGTEISFQGNKTIRFAVQNNTEFWREGANDIYTSRTVSAFEAMTGAELEIQTLDEKLIKLSIDPGTSPGETYRLSGWGGPETYDGAVQGDMYVVIEVDVPEITDEESKELIDQIRN